MQKINLHWYEITFWSEVIERGYDDRRIIISWHHEVMRVIAQTNSVVRARTREEVAMEWTSGHRVGTFASWIYEYSS